MLKATYYAPLIFYTFILSIFEQSNCYNLKMLSVIFRHGDRTPETLYPKDPHNIKEFYPVDLGGLINIGKKREFDLGTHLRKTYNGYLGDLYIPSDVYAQTTGYDRTQMSLLLVLAGLYPPKDPQRWHPNLAWQPIPIISFPKNNDPLLHPVPCPTWRTEMTRVKNTDEYKKEVAKFQDLMNKLSEHTGLKITGTNQVINIFHTLTSEKAMNMTLPEWTKPFFPKGPLIDASLFQYKTVNYNNLLKKLNGGTILKRVFDDMNAVKQGKGLPKIFLYSAHEMTVAAVLYALNIWKPVIPEYSSAVIIELWEQNGSFFVKVAYYKGIPANAETRIIPGCKKYCPFQDFEKSLKDVLPADYEKECRGGAPSTQPFK